MPLTVIGSVDVRSLLFSLTYDDTVEIRRSLADSLRRYSAQNQETGSCKENSKQQIAIRRQNGLDTFIRPLMAEGNVGFNTTTVLDDTREQSTPIASDTEEAQALSPYLPASLTLLDSIGMPTGVINTEDLTPFRTAMTSLMLLTRRRHVEVITVFGAGRHAYWHIRLALLLRGSEIKRVNIINRTFDRASQLLRQIYSSDQTHWRSDVKFSAVSQDFVEYDRLLQDHILKADAIFCCTSSPDPLFPADILISGEGKRKGRFISTVGACQSSMMELDPDIFRKAVEPQHHHHYRRLGHKRPPHSGVVVVDNLESCLKEGGEIIQAGLEPRQLVEIGELVMVREASAEESEAPDKSLVDWIEKGNVIYKSAGLGVLDLVLAKDMIRRAVEKGVGTTISEF